PRGGHGIRARDVLAGVRRLVGRAHRGGGRRHRGRLRSDHQVPRRGVVDRRTEVLDGRRPSEHIARVAVAPEHPGRARGERSVWMTDTTVAKDLDAEVLRSMYEQMAVTRGTEKAAYDLFMSGKVKGTTHRAAGHEAVAVGASAALRPDDYVFATYRGHHHAMARGATAEE